MNIINEKIKKETAVSPVVGVMLMLVVTIVVAAVVASFSGGVSVETQKSPTFIISGTYSQSSGLVLTHMGGDDIINADIYVRPSTGFGDAYSKLTWKTKTINDKDVWHTGDSLFVEAKDIQPKTDGTTDAGGSNAKYYGFNYNKFEDTSMGHFTPAIGKSFTVEVVKDGVTIAKTDVKITA